MGLSLAQVQPNYKEIEKLSPQVAFSPESMDQINASEANPRNDTELAKEMARTDLSPNAIAALQEEKTRRAGLKTGLSLDSIQPDEPKTKLSLEDIQPEPGKGMSLEDIQPEAPATIPYLMAKAQEGAMGLIGGGIQAAGSLANAAGGLVGEPSFADPVIKAGTELKGFANRVPGYDPTLEQNATLPQKIGGMAAQVPLLVAAGGAAPVVAAANSAWNTGTDLLNKGSTLTQAQEAAAVAGTTGYVGMKLPAAGKTLVGSAAIGTVSNAGAGAVTDAMLHTILSDNPELAKEYRWDDLEKRLPEAVFGGIFGAGIHGANVANQKIAAVKDAKTRAEVADKADAYMTKGLEELDSFLQPVIGGQALYRPPEGKSVGQHLDNLLSPRADGTVHPDGTVQNVLDLMSQRDSWHPNTTEPEVLQKYAQYLSKLVRDLGLDGTMVIPSNEQRSSHYDPNNDTIVLGGNRSQRVALHEIGHSITERIVSEYEKVKDGQTIDPRFKDAVAKVKPLDDIFETLLKRREETVPDVQDRLMQAEHTVETLHDTPHDLLTADEAVRLNEAREFIHDNYHWKDLHEFISEFISQPTFRKYLSDIEVSPKQAATLYPSRDQRLQVRGFAEGIRQQLAKTLGMPVKGSMVDPVFSHIANIFENVKGEDRTDLAKSGVQARLNELVGEAFKEGAPSKLSQSLLLRIKRIMDLTAGDKNAFLTMLHMEAPGSKAWTDFITNNAENLWNNQVLFHKYMDNSSSYKDLSPAEQRYTADPRTADVMMKETMGGTYLNENGRLIRSLPESEDITGIIGSNFHTPANLSILHSREGTMGGIVLKWFLDQEKEYLTLGNKLHAVATGHFKDFTELHRKEQIGLMDQIISMNSVEGQAALKAQGRNWATPEDLKARGMNDAQIKSYEGLTKGTDFLFDLLNQTQAIQGLPPLERIPGYMPHVFDGNYKVFVTKKDPDGNEKVVLVKGFSTRYGAQLFNKKLNSGKFDHEGVEYRPQTFADSGLPYKIKGSREGAEQGLSTAMADHMATYLTQMKLEPNVLEALQSIERDSMAGMNPHTLESSNVAGFIGSQGMKKEWLSAMGIGSTANNKALLLYHDYAKSVTDYYRNNRFIHDVVGPLKRADTDPTVPDHEYAELLKNTPGLNRYITEATMNFTGQNVNHLKVFDQAAKELAVKLGINPFAARDTSRAIRNAMSKVKLRLSIPYHASSFFQPAMVMGMIDMAAAERSLGGQKTAYGAQAMGKWAKKVATGGWDAEDTAALQWARDTQQLSAQLGHEFTENTISKSRDTLQTLSGAKIADQLEGEAKERSFMMAFQHTRDIYSDPFQARTAALKIMDMAMVDYQREQKPLMYQNYGTIGQSISPFATFRNAYMGNLQLAAKLISKNPAKLRSYMPMLSTQLGFMAIAGAAGTWMSQEYNAIIDLLNKLDPSFELKHAEDSYFKHLPDWMTYGVPSAVSGLNLSGSMGSPDTGSIFNVPLIKFMDAAKDVALIAGSQFRQIPRPLSDLYGPSKIVAPNILHPGIEAIMQGDSSDNNIGYKAQSATGLIQRTPEEKVVNVMSMGRQSVSETKKRVLERQLTVEAKTQKDMLRSLTEIGADNYLGLTERMSTKEATERAAALGVAPKEFFKGIQDAVELRMTNAKQRDAKVKDRQAIKRIYERERLE